MTTIKNQYSYSTDKKVEVVREYLASGTSISNFCKDRELNRHTLGRWVRDYKHIAELEDGRIQEGHFIERETAQYKDGKLVNLYIKTKKDSDSLRDGLERFLTSALQDVKVIDPVPAPRRYLKDFALVIPIADAHIGSFACKNTGDPWDLEIAEEQFCKAIQYIINRSESCENCYIFNLGDYFHYHGLTAKTERSGHVVDASGSPYCMIDVGERVAKFAINEALKKHKNVIYDGVCGNHDGLLQYMLCKSLKNAFAKNKRVKVIVNHNMRHYHKFGINLFGIVHGHQTKDPLLPITMAEEAAHLWGANQHRVFFRGHHHTNNVLIVDEKIGVTVEQVRTLASSGRYAKENQFLSKRDLKGIYYHKDFGEDDRITCGSMLLEALINGKK